MEFTEKDIEDQVQDLPSTVVHPNARCVGRQVTLPSGRRIDLLAVHRPDDGNFAVLTVVEIKARTSGIPDLLQLCRYVEELRTGRYINTPVQGVLLSPGHNSDVVLLAEMMDGVGLHEFALRVDVGQSDDEGIHGRGRLVRIGVWSEPPWSGSVRDVVDDACDKWTEARRKEREWNPGKRWTALVPIHDTPTHVCYGNGNGARP